MSSVTQRSVFDHLLMLERRETEGLQENHQQKRLQEFGATIETLRMKRNQIKAETSAIKNFKDRLDQGLTVEDNETEDFVWLEKALLTCWHMQLQDLLTAHNLIAGYDLVEAKQGRSVCVAFSTAFEGVCLETYNLELDLTHMQISRHNIPPCVPLETLAKENLQIDLKYFLQTLSLHLNSLAGRRQQIVLIKELLGTVEVMERNQLCNFLILMCKAQAESDTALLLTLDYGDLSRCFPTKVTIDCEDKLLLESTQWKKNRVLLMESPVHSALLTMRKMGSIA